MNNQRNWCAWTVHSLAPHPLLEGKHMMELVDVLVSNGIGVVCVAYLMYFQQTTMTKMLETLSSISERLSVIENVLEKRE